MILKNHFFEFVYTQTQTNIHTRTNILLLDELSNYLGCVSVMYVSILCVNIRLTMY